MQHAALALSPGASLLVALAWLRAQLRRGGSPRPAPPPQVAFNSAPGEMAVVDTEFGWHVIRIDDVSTVPLEMSPAELKARLAPGAPPLQLIDVRDMDELE